MKKRAKKHVRSHNRDITMRLLQESLRYCADLELARNAGCTVGDRTRNLAIALAEQALSKLPDNKQAIWLAANIRTKKHVTTCSLPKEHIEFMAQRMNEKNGEHKTNGSIRAITIQDAIRLKIDLCGVII